MQKRIVKFCLPSKFDKEPQLTRVDVMVEEGKYDQYIQVAPDNEPASWVRFGVFLESALWDHDDKEFLKKCLISFLEREHTKDSVEGAQIKS